MLFMDLLIASDHGGYGLKERLKDYIETTGHKAIDLGTDSRESTDFVDYADELCQNILSDEYERGILICTTGQGMVMAANRYKKIRATLCPTIQLAEQAREHLNSNVLVLGEKTCMDEPEYILDTWLGSDYLAKRRYERRRRKLDR